MKKIANIASFSTVLALLVLLLFSLPAGAWPIPDTGQVKCYNNSGEITCPQSGAAFYGQDGNYSINPPSYTKLDASGNALPDAATTWTMVKDNVTGLIWENKTNNGTIHDGNGIRTFTWCDKNPATNGGNQGSRGTGTGDAATDTESYIKALNDATFGGFSDWRMPSPQELTAMIDRSRVGPAVNLNWFPNTMPSDNSVSVTYWSSSTSVLDLGYAWCVNSHDGNMSLRSKSGKYAVRAVRSGQSRSLNNLLVNGDGTVTDTATGLMWQQESVSGKTWGAALSHAEGLELAGFNDWRLPTMTELQSIVDYNRSYPSIDTHTFPGTL